jgi:hypothetical protein
MNPSAPSSRPRRIWPWVLLVLLSPFVVVGAVAVSILTLDGDARVLRREVMAASDTHWHTKIQCSVGGVVLGVARTVLDFVPHKNATDARAALAAIRHASVGVYELAGPEPEWSASQLFGHVDDVMAGRGWTRLVGVEDNRDRVLVYAEEQGGGSNRLNLCLAVMEDRELVVVSTSVDSDQLAKAVQQISGHHGHPMHLAGLF